MTIFIEILIAALLVVAGVFGLVGSYALAKLPQLMMRLHGPTKATTVGIGALLIASMLYFAGVKGEPSLHELLITLFLFVTAPITANMIAKAYLHRHTDAGRALPPTGRDVGWASFDAPPEIPGDEPDSMASPRHVD